MPNLEEKIVSQIAELAIVQRKMTFDKEKGLKAQFDGLKKLRQGQVTPVWTVSYLTEKNPYFDQNMHFVNISDDTAEVLYIITPTSYIE